MRRLLSCLALCVVASCGGDPSAARNGGTVVIGTPTDADALLMPLVDGIQGRVVSELLFDRLADIGPALNTVGDAGFEPRLARSWRWSGDSLAITFALDPAAKWHDGKPVRAADVVFGLKAIRDSGNVSSLVASTAHVVSAVALDSLSVEIRFSRRAPEQFYSATLIVPLPEHVYGAIPSGGLRTSPEARAPVGSGRFRLVRWESGVRIELAAVEDHYRGRPHLDRVLFSIAPEVATGLARLKAGDTDVWDPIPPAEIADVGAQPNLRLVTSPSFDYAFMAFNFRDPKDPSRPHPLFADAGVRRAVTLAVDRAVIVKAIFDTLALPSLGPFVRAQATADTTLRQIPFDRAAADALLDSLGWKDRGPDGVRRRGGRALAFSVNLPTTSRTRERAAVLIQEQLRAVGIAMSIERMDFPVFLAAQTAGKFDALMGGTRTTPSPGGVRGSWASSAIPGGGTQNPWHYQSAPFDAAVEAGLDAMDPTESKAQLRKAYQQIIDDAAAVWLFELRNVSAVHRRLVVPAWRPDAWWLTLGEWSVDPAQRLPRDAAPAAP
jgi:peptide/nickel transport system substrate-binding protein